MNRNPRALITTAASGPRAAIVLLTATAMVLANAQSLEDIVEDQITSEVESSVVEAVEQAIETRIEERAEAQVQDAVAEAIGQQLESAVSETIEQQLESSVTDTLEQQIEAGVTEALEQQLEGGVASLLEQQLESVLERELETQVGEALQQGLESLLEQGLVENVADTLQGQLQGTIGEVTNPTDAGDAGERSFFADIDDDGHAIEREIWVLLVPADQVASLDAWGFTVRSQEALESLDAELVTVIAPVERSLAEAALELAIDAPGTAVDLNHVYRSNTGVTKDEPASTLARQQGAAAPLRAQESAGTPQGRPGHATPMVGVIDTAVSVAHEALSSAAIVQRDFVRFSAPRPLAHGTAVASLLVGESVQLQGHVREGRLYAASVFFEDAEGAPAALTTALIEAIAWLVEARIPVINMSLSGPPNRALEAAIERAVARDVVIVAAVGNNGPTGRPLYPAAYDTVVGVTAVDGRHRVYRHAGRGEHVMFAAPGVRIRVARPGGGYTTESGTSIAAPYVSAVIATALHASGQVPQSVIEKLKAAARRLGTSEFDPVYGYGLVTWLE